MSKSPIAGLHVNELVSTEGTTTRSNAQAGEDVSMSCILFRLRETEGDRGMVWRKSVLRVVGYGVAFWFSSPCERGERKPQKHPLHAARRQ